MPQAKQAEHSLSLARQREGGTQVLVVTFMAWQGGQSSSMVAHILLHFFQKHGQ